MTYLSDDFFNLFIMIESPFQSFFQGGFESCYTLNEHRKRMDMLHDTRHDVHCREDYKLLKNVGIYTIREGLAWYQIDKGDGKYDFSRFTPIMEIAREEGMQVIWSLNHFDFPEDLDPYSPEFIPRFATYAVEAIKIIRQYNENTIYLIPFNEISFISWICGDIGVWHPYAHGRGMEMKIQLVKAVIAVVQAIKAADSNVQFIHTDPIMRRIALSNANYAIRRYVRDFNEIIYQAWDMITGKMMPELGGKPEYMDIVGLNYYISNQDVVKKLPKSGGIETYHLNMRSRLRVGFDVMLEKVYERYQKPMLITETGSYGNIRMPWWRRLLKDIDAALEKKLPLLGVCSYPIIDRPDWSDGHLTNSGFWDFENGDADCRRIPHQELLDMISAYSERKSFH